MKTVFAVAGLALLLIASVPRVTTAQNLVVTNARILDGKGGVIDRGSVVVRDGKIVSGNPTVNVQGQVADSGGLRVIVGDGMRKANGSGKLSGTSGSGTWSAVGICSGTWVAQRN